MTSDTLISELTVGELQQIIRQTVESCQQPQGRRISGNRELAEFLGCSEATVLRYKQAGVFRTACYQRGRTIIYDADKALQCFGSHGTRK